MTGEVFSAASGPIPGTAIDIWVGTTNMSYAYMWAHGGLHSDAAGSFTTAYLPQSTLHVLAFNAAFRQPCAVTVDSHRTTPFRVELVELSAFDAPVPPRPQLAMDPSVTGMVYENTATGRKPVSGAEIQIEHGFEIQTATAITGREGRFYVCNLPPEVTVWVSKPGFVTLQVWPVNTTRGVPLEFELRRQQT